MRGTGEAPEIHPRVQFRKKQCATIAVQGGRDARAPIAAHEFRAGRQFSFGWGRAATGA